MAGESLDQHDFMTTFTGRRIDPVDPRTYNIDIMDIAHALSHLCRFTGHTRTFYSVAQHCLLASYHVEERYALEALLHDATEAYINDLSRPLKHHPKMQAYVDIEELMDTVIRKRYGLPATMSPAVKQVDGKLVIDEALTLLTETTWTDGHPRLGITIEPTPSMTVRRQFLDRFFDLGGC